MNKGVIHVGLIAAMPEEIGEAIKHLKLTKTIKNGDLEIFIGFLKFNKNVKVTLAWSGWGKVSAARAITRIISSANQDEPIQIILFSGVAGAAQSFISQWDIVISEKVIQHDMDASPIYEKFVIPAINKDLIKANENWREWSYKTIQNNLNSLELEGFGNLYSGIIATGDKFISDKSILKELDNQIPNILAVEMEGAAVAQVAEQENIPWLILRVISDSADNSADISFTEFLKIYNFYSWKLINTLFSNIDNCPIYMESTLED